MSYIADEEDMRAIHEGCGGDIILEYTAGYGGTEPAAYMKCMKCESTAYT